MVRLRDEEVRNAEVKAWRGLHVFHARMSSCSQKLRIFLNLKGIDWQGHELDLARAESWGEAFLAINPRGLVPVIVLDGAVHIESNDILALLDELYPEHRLIPPAAATEVARLLREEDDLHLDLRTLSFRFVMARTGSNKTPEMLARYRNSGATVAGAPDDGTRDREAGFYERLAAEGITDDAVATSAARFRAAFDALESWLAETTHCLGKDVSVIDIAWFVYASRLDLAGYPFAHLHPRVHAWRERLAGDPRFAAEVAPPAPLAEALARNQATWARAGRSLADVAGLG